MSLGFNLSGLRPQSISEGTRISEAWGQGTKRLSLDLEYTEGHWGPDRSGARRESKTESESDQNEVEEGRLIRYSNLATNCTCRQLFIRVRS